MKVSVHESVTVTSETPLVDLTSTSVGANISNQLTERIPIGRSLGDIIYLAPGVVKGGIGGANLRISGGSGLDNTYIVDGAVVTNPGFGGLGTMSPVFGFQGGNGLPVEAIQEVQVITGGFEPEYGEAQGGVINVITKSGSNNFHGQGYTYYSPVAAGDEFYQDQYGVDAGVNMGGAIIKNKLFFFGAYNLTTSKTKLFLQPEWPGYAVLQETTNKVITNAYSFKVTSNPITNHTLEFSASGDPSYRPLSNQFGYGLDNSINPLMFQSEWRFGSNSQVVRWNGILGPNMFLEAQAARVYNHLHDLTNPFSIDVPRIVDWTKGGIDVGGFGGRVIEDSTNLQYSVKLTNLWKNHQFRYGLQFQDISYDSKQHRTGGTFRLSNGEVTSNYRIDIDPGELEGSRLYWVGAWSDSALGPTSSKYLNWFAQDSWNLTSDLNVTLGIRWERQQLREDRNGYGLTLNNNWAPRIGATYDYLRNGKSKLFFHYGRFFEKLPNYLAVSFIDFHTTDEAYSDPALTDLVHEPVINFFRGSRAEGQGSFDSNYRTGAQYSNEWTAGIEQEVKPGFSLGAHFIFRNLGRALESVLANPDNSYIAVTAEDARTTHYLTGLVTNIDGHIPGVPALVRDYKAIEITAEKRLSNRWQLMASYTYAQLIGNYQGRNGSVWGPASVFALSPFTEFSWAKGPLPDDIRNMVKVFSSYQWHDNLNTGLAFYFQTGRPITALKLGDFGTFPHSPRGAYGRTNSFTSVDVNANYSIHVLNEQKITFGLDLFNLFNSQRLTDVDEVAQFYDSDLQLDQHEYFLFPGGNQPSRSYRLLLRYSF